VLMVVIAMLVMVMVITMVIVITGVMVITGVVVIRVIMVVIMIMRRVPVRGRLARMDVAAGIGAAFGIERRLDLDDARTQPRHHRLDDVIAPDPQALWHDLRGQMPVAEMPGDPDPMQWIGTPDLDQRLGRGNHLDQPAILQHQRIAAAQGDGVFEVEQKFQPAGAGHRHPPPVPVVEIEHDGVGRRLRPAMLALNLRGADHVDLRFERSFCLSMIFSENRYPLFRIML
jgi:hypothetical protein